MGGFTLSAREAGKLYLVAMDGKQVAEYNLATGTTKIEMPGKLAAGLYMCRHVSAYIKIGINIDKPEGLKCE